jgi:F0F1-type ATP synthase assembly protein I
MSAYERKTKKKPTGIMVLTGIISIGLYVALLTNQDLLNSNFAKGGLYAFLPIITAFAFSFIHGSFTGHFWTVLGVEAARKKREVR